MILRETIAVYLQNNIKHVNKICDENTVFLNVKVDSTYKFH